MRNIALKMHIMMMATWIGGGYSCSVEPAGVFGARVLSSTLPFSSSLLSTRVLGLSTFSVPSFGAASPDWCDLGSFIVILPRGAEVACCCGVGRIWSGLGQFVYVSFSCVLSLFLLR